MARASLLLCVLIGCGGTPGARDGGVDGPDAATADSGGEPDTGAGPDAGLPASCAPLAGYDDLVAQACTYERTHAPGETMPVDVFAPVGATQAPVVIYVHGGGFIQGSRHGARVLLARWARTAGVVGMTIEYELRPSGGVIPVPTDPIDTRDEMEFERDAASALLWARDHAAAFGGDPDHVVVVGHSAGGIIVSLLSTDPRWIREALVSSGRATAIEAEAVLPADLIAGVANLSGPVLIDLGRVYFGGRIQELVNLGFTPAMQLEASALDQLAATGASPPMFLVAGGGANAILADPAPIATNMRELLVLARSQGISAHFVQPAFQSERIYTNPLLMMYSGVPCWTHLSHVDTELAQFDDTVALIPDQAYSDGLPGVCNQHVLDGVRVPHDEYRAALQAFVLEPGAPIPWATPVFTHLSIPDADPEPLRVNLGGGALPGPGAWSDGSTAVTLDGALRSLNDETFDLTGVQDSTGAAVPPGVFHFQLVPFGTGTEFTVHIAVAPGSYVTRLYFGEAGGDRRMDVLLEGTLAASDVSSLGGAPVFTARVVELPSVDSDATFDLTLRRTGTAGRTPRIAGVELVPAP